MGKGILSTAGPEIKCVLRQEVKKQFESNLSAEAKSNPKPFGNTSMVKQKQERVLQH